MKFVIDVDVAKEVDVPAALMYANLDFWCEKNEANEKHFEDGVYWTYNTLDALVRLFPFWKKGQVRRILEKLVDAKLIAKGNYNKRPADRTLWYSTLRDGSGVNSICRKQHNHMPKSAHGNAEIGTALPDITPDINTDTPPTPSSHNLLPNKFRSMMEDHVGNMLLNLVVKFHTEQLNDPEMKKWNRVLKTAEERLSKLNLESAYALWMIIKDEGETYDMVAETIDMIRKDPERDNWLGWKHYCVTLSSIRKRGNNGEMKYFNIKATAGKKAYKKKFTYDEAVHYALSRGLKMSDILEINPDKTWSLKDGK